MGCLEEVLILACRGHIVPSFPTVRSWSLSSGVSCSKERRGKKGQKDGVGDGDRETKGKVSSSQMSLLRRTLIPLDWSLTLRPH